MAATWLPCPPRPDAILRRRRSAVLADAGSCGIQSAPVLDGVTGGRHRLRHRPYRPPEPPMFYRPDQPDAPRSGILNALVVPRPIGWISTLEPSRPSQSRPLLLLQRRGLPPAAGDVLGHGRPRPWRPQGLGRQHRGDRRVRGQPRHLGPARGGQRQLDRGPARLRRVRARRPRPRRQPTTVKPPRVAREPGPSRMRAVADRRARIALRPTGPTAWSSAASSASTSPTR